ncbi:MULTISPECIES: hypothetical protein [unclassified Pseudomonas]|uniref:hypothetical protein n=1 Tax=unclassified Pseudomonas TaxID=196821 RepID=UPI000A089C2E|nr:MULTISPECIES: hypothetical protein [unclassified Pseudomonas]RAS21134.1 hypothetical protein H040_05012 [Pseudomonas sp. URMO17WK12:I7]SMF59378.1 hypothetical protein SAMN02745903_04477 [Pseudomonas sp. URMO17WK12:I5]
MPMDLTHNDGVLEPPLAPAMLDDITDGAPGLLPVAALSQPLRIEVPQWPISSPGPDMPETLSLYWGGELVDAKTWYAAINPDELFIDVPTDSLLKEGEFQVTYRVLGYNGVEIGSKPLTLTIDRTAPVLGGDRGRLEFPDLGSQPVTDKFLKDNGEVLRGQVPVYQTFMPGDTIVYYWDDEPLDNTQVGEVTLTSQDAGNPVIIEYDGKMIRERGDGGRYAQYLVRDRAGNSSPVSVPKAVTVDAKPIPRVLPRPEVPLATGSQEQVTLKLVDVDEPVEIRIPGTAVIHPGEPFTVEWAPGLFGEQLLQGVEGVSSYRVAERHVVALSGKTVPLRYTVDGSDGPWWSDVRRVVIEPLPRSSMPIPQLSGTTGTTFSLKQQTRDPAITLAPWKLISQDQWVRIEIRGVSAEGASDLQVMRNHAVTEGELTSGIGATGDATVPLAFLSSLLLGQNFTIEVMVSFDAGRTWPALPNFEPLEITLLA